MAGVQTDSAGCPRFSVRTSHAEGLTLRPFSPLLRTPPRLASPRARPPLFPGRAAERPKTTLTTAPSAYQSHILLIVLSFPFPTPCAVADGFGFGQCYTDPLQSGALGVRS